MCIERAPHKKTAYLCVSDWQSGQHCGTMRKQLKWTEVAGFFTVCNCIFALALGDANCLCDSIIYRTQWPDIRWSSLYWAPTWLESAELQCHKSQLFNEICGIAIVLLITMIAYYLWNLSDCLGTLYHWKQHCLWLLCQQGGSQFDSADANTTGIEQG